jgi:hypothetical protein
MVLGLTYILLAAEVRICLVAFTQAPRRSVVSVVARERSLTPLNTGTQACLCGCPPPSHTPARLSPPPRTTLIPQRRGMSWERGRQSTGYDQRSEKGVSSTARSSKSKYSSRNLNAVHKPDSGTRGGDRGPRPPQRNVTSGGMTHERTTGGGGGGAGGDTSTVSRSTDHRTPPPPPPHPAVP